jgi:2-iminobutanoate/2-iminopropanoate deaminase
MSASPGRVRCACARWRHASTTLTFYHRTGYYPQPPPFIPVLQVAGIVEAVAQGARGLKVGDWVAYAGPIGGYPEVRLISARNLRHHHYDHLTQYPQEFAMSKTAIASPELAPPVGPFSQAIEVGGFLYFSGQVGQDPATGKVVEGGIVAETERVFRNLSAVLKAGGKSFDHVARAGVYLTSMSDFVAMNGIYAKYFSQPFPARTTIAVAALPLGACVEIDLVVKA